MKRKSDENAPIAPAAVERVFCHYKRDYEACVPAGPVSVERMFEHYRVVRAAPKHSLHRCGIGGGERAYLMVAVVSKRRPTGTGPEEAPVACG
jgi:hypothetical protein